MPEKTKQEVGLVDIKGGVHLTGDMPLATLRQKHCHACFSQSSAINGSHLQTRDWLLWSFWDAKGRQNWCKSERYKAFLRIKTKMELNWTSKGEGFLVGDRISNFNVTPKKKNRWFRHLNTRTLFFVSRGHRCFSGDLVRSLYRSDAEKDSNWYPTDSCPKSQDKSLACHFNWVKGKEARAEVHGA